jgi:predicted DNA-binding ribbon-helix-helix protein
VIIAPLTAFRREADTIVVHNGVMKTAQTGVRQSISLPPSLAKQVGSMAKSRKLSKNRMLLELIEKGIDAEKRKQQQFFALAERFRNEQDPEAANRLGDELGRMVFGG